MRTDVPRMTILQLPLILASFSAGFLAAIPGPKPAISHSPSIKPSHFQNFVLRHIAVYPPRISRDCPISTQPLAFTHREISQIFFSQIFRKSTRTHPQNLGYVQNSRLCSKLRKPLFMLPSEEFFFQKNFPKKIQGLQTAQYLTFQRNFSKNFFQKFSKEN